MGKPKRCCRSLAILLVGISLAACGTPDAVKHLSTAQVANLDAAVIAVEAQGEGLITLLRREKTRREERIERLHQKIVRRYEARAAENFSGEAEKKVAAKNAFDQVLKSEKSRTTALARLDHQFKIIEAKNAELNTYVRKLKDAQTVLDGYLQSERLGEALLGEAMSVPVIGQAIDAVNALKKKVTSGAKQLESLVDNFVKP